MIHDITYQYGFHEKAGNFQQDNFGRGGKEQDALLINNHAKGSGIPDFGVPPDGQQPILNMHFWELISNPVRDGSLDNSVLIHEYAHGISTRLTGGSEQANCLQTTEGLGLGEGWSDAIALFLLQKPDQNRSSNAAIGDYIADYIFDQMDAIVQGQTFHEGGGIRSRPYSTNMTVNARTLRDAFRERDIYVLGELWASALFDMYWNLVDQHGFSSNYMDATQMKGNIMAMQILIGGLKLQPCQPRFLSARDAILAADQAYYGGINKCLIWKAFAKRGMGVDAVNEKFHDGFNFPMECGGVAPCSHDKCSNGVGLLKECDPCVAQIINKHQTCTSGSWDDFCVEQVKQICGIIC